MKAYLDNAATAVSYPLASFAHKDGFIGNPSSLHPVGLGARHALDDAKDILCAAFGGKRYNYIFTSGATESANLAIIREQLEALLSATLRAMRSSYLR